jgi:hypothetical protein
LLDKAARIHIVEILIIGKDCDGAEIFLYRRGSSSLFFFRMELGRATHIFINKEAVKHLPPSFPFFANNISWISQHAVDADNRKSNDPTEAPKHFIDIEDYPEFATHTLSHNYDTLVAKHGLSFVTNAGVVPWSIIWSFDSLTNCLRRGDSARALQFAADLGHYVGDAHQPLHATANYDGPNGTHDGVHARYESTMLATYNYLSYVTVVAKSVHFVPVPVDTNFAFVMHGNGLADSIFDADAYATSIDAKYGSAYYAALWAKTGAMTQNQIQDATVDLANLWYTAAVNAGLVADSSSLISLGASRTMIAFGKVTLGSFKDTTVTITNNGADVLYITSIASSGNPFSVRTTSASLAPGQSLVDTLRYTPAVLGPASGEIVLTSNAASSPDTIKVGGSGVGQAVLHLLAHSVSFGNVKIGQSRDTTVIITNNGNDTLKITGVTAGSPNFSAKPSGHSLPPRPIIFRHAYFFPVVDRARSRIDSHREQLGHVSGHGDGRRERPVFSRRRDLANGGTGSVRPLVRITLIRLTLRR